VSEPEDVTHVQVATRPGIEPGTSGLRAWVHLGRFNWGVYKPRENGDNRERKHGKCAKTH
jgi:hypothetical protein